MFAHFKLKVSPWWRWLQEINSWGMASDFCIQFTHGLTSLEGKVASLTLRYVVKLWALQTLDIFAHLNESKIASSNW